MVERAVAAMQPATAAAHADALFGFLQQALDVRQRDGVPSADATAVERAATATLVAATMKLSEKQFKPLFLRLLTWASTPPAGQPGDPPSRFDIFSHVKLAHTMCRGPLYQAKRVF